MPNFMIGDDIILTNGKEAKIIQEYDYDTKLYTIRVGKKVEKITEDKIKKLK